MRARLLPTDEFGEFGKDVVVVVLTINKTEAEHVIDDLHTESQGYHELSAPSRRLYDTLKAVAERAPNRLTDYINTDGRFPVPRVQTPF